MKESPPARKASLDRILSPQVSRRSPYTSSPQTAASLTALVRDKSLSPVAAVPLSTSMSNASIQSAHSTYSEDSLIGQQQRFGHPNCQQCAIDVDFTGATTPVAQRWNNINYDPHSGKDQLDLMSIISVYSLSSTCTCSLLLYGVSPFLLIASVFITGRTTESTAVVI